MPALELLTGFVTAPSTTITALGMAAGNSNTIRNTELEADIRLVSLWADNQGAGLAQVRSPRMHDNVRGLTIDVVASELEPLSPHGAFQKLFAQDQLTLGLSGSATAGDIETMCMLIYYDSLPGAEARLIDYEELMARAVNIIGIDNTLSLGTAGGYSGEEAINAESDLMRANTDYALIGYQVSAECACVRWRGVDTGNLGVGGPGHAERKQLTAAWFADLSKRFGKPLIPVFNSANKAGILLDGAQDENGTDSTVTSLMVELAR